VHVWQAPLDLAEPRLAQLRSVLAPDEQARAQRFHFAHDRAHYIAARGTLRTILARYLGLRPQQLRFDYTPHGKPTLSPAILPVGTTLTFNVSHSHELALFAVARGRRVGVDVELVRQELADERIAERFFSAREVMTLRTLPASEQPVAFFNCWTRKEAFVKARGEGLSLPLDRFDVTLVPGAAANLLATHDDPAEAQRWQLLDLAPRAGYAAALAAEGCNWLASGWRISEDFFDKETHPHCASPGGGSVW
jgi:4'-phosphopantetheinyl transferase